MKASFRIQNLTNKIFKNHIEVNPLEMFLLETSLLGVQVDLKPHQDTLHRPDLRVLNIFETNKLFDFIETEMIDFNQILKIIRVAIHLESLLL